MSLRASRENIDKALLDQIDSSTEDNGFFLNELPVGTKIKFRTKNSVYDIEIRRRSGEPDPDWLDTEVWLRGHPRYCPDWTPVEWHGCTWGSSCLKLFWIGVGMYAEFWAKPEDGRIVTSEIQSVRRVQ